MSLCGVLYNANCITSYILQKIAHTLYLVEKSLSGRGYPLTLLTVYTQDVYSSRHFSHIWPISDPSLSHRWAIVEPSLSHRAPIKPHKGIQTPSGQSPSFICLISSTGPHFQGTDPNYEKTFPFSQRSPNTLPTPHISIFSVNSCFWKCAYPHPKRTPARDFLSTKKIPYKILFRYLIQYSLYLRKSLKPLFFSVTSVAKKDFCKRTIPQTGTWSKSTRLQKHLSAWSFSPPCNPAD